MTTFKRCQHGRDCPYLRKRRHGSWFWQLRIDTTGGRILVRRGGFGLDRDATATEARVLELVALDPDPAMRARIGDLIVASTLRGGELPDPAAIRRKIGAGLAPDSPDVTLAEWLRSWLSGKGALKASTRRSYTQHIEQYWVPLLGTIPLVRVRAEHIAGVFATIRGWNAEIERQRAEGRALIVLDGDVRAAPQVVSDATMARIYATLRTALNAAVRQRLIAWNPAAGVELPAGERHEANVYGPEEVVLFLEACAGHRLALFYRMTLLRGFRRGEGLGLRRCDVHDDGMHVDVVQAILELGGKVIIDSPKSRTSRRTVSLDAETAGLLKEHLDAQRRERFRAGSAYTDTGLIFANEVGGCYRPDWVSREFKRLARQAGLPPIRLHDARHSAATLALEAGLDVKIVAQQLGHSTTAITNDIYQHVRRVVADDAADRVAALLPRREAAG